MILSEFAGAAWELRDAIACNPFDVEGLSLRIEHALGLSAGDRRAAITAMARHVAAHDVHRWVAAQLSDIRSAASSSAEQYAPGRSRGLSAPALRWSP